MKTTCLTAILLFASAVGAQPGAPAFAAQGAFVAIVVTDLDASVHWYESNLGLHLLKRGKSPRVAAEAAVLGGRNLLNSSIMMAKRCRELTTKPLCLVFSKRE